MGIGFPLILSNELKTFISIELHKLRINQQPWEFFRSLVEIDRFLGIFLRRMECPAREFKHQPAGLFWADNLHKVVSVSAESEMIR